MKFGVEKIRVEHLNSVDSKLKIGRWYNVLIYINPIIIGIIFVWLIYQSVISEPDDWWNPFNASSTGTMVVQWAIVMVILFLANNKLAKYFNPEKE